MGSLWIQTYRLNLSKSSSQESRGFNHGSVNVYAHRPRGFMQMNKWAIRNTMKKETVDVPVTDEMLEGVKMYDGTSLKDLTLSRLVEEGRKAKAVRDGDPGTKI